MTFSPMVSAAGAAPDPDGTAPDPGTGAGQAAGSPPGSADTPGSGQAGDPGQTGSAPDPGQAGSTADTGQAGYAGAERYAGAGQAEYATNPGQAEYATDPEQAEYAGAEQAEYAGSGQEDGASVPWPNQSFLELGALPTAAPCARLHTALVLREWQLGGLVQTATLVVSELVSNAVQASAPLTGSRFAGEWAPGTPPVRMWLSADEHRLVIQVWDGSDQPPVPQPVEPEADNGRGLLLVGALSTEWGCYTPEKSSGKVVWAVVTG